MLNYNLIIKLTKFCNAAVLCIVGSRYSHVFFPPFANHNT